MSVPGLVGGLQPTELPEREIGCTTPRRWPDPHGSGNDLRKEEGQMKTLAIRLEDEQHARLTILAKLSEQSITDVIRNAVDARLEQMATDPEISAKAESLTAAIEREAAEQRSAIAALFGSPTPKTPPKSRSRG